MTSFQRGTLNASKDGVVGTASRSQSWGIDAAGNFTSVTSDGSTQTRTSNAQNEVTSVSGATTPAYDADGNLTTDETGRQLVYDAWGRLVEVKDSSGNTIVTYAYDALGRRISETRGAVKTDLYYSAGWQVVEERTNGQTSAQYVWSPVYPDALVLRDRDTNGDGTLDERLWALQDANFNVTALVDNSGNVVERYAYDPYGAATVLAPDFSARTGGSSYGWVYLFQGLRYDGQTGLYNARHRDSSPTLMRWVENDPLGFAAGDVNLYRALANDPTRHTDPSGEILPVLPFVIGGALFTGAGVCGLHWAASRYDNAEKLYMNRPIRAWTPDVQAEYRVYIKRTDWLASGSEVAGWTGISAVATPYVGFGTGYAWTAGRPAVRGGLGLVGTGGAGLVGYEGYTIARDWDTMDGPQRLRRLGNLGGPLMVGLGAGPRFFIQGRARAQQRIARLIAEAETSATAAAEPTIEQRTLQNIRDLEANLESWRTTLDQAIAQGNSVMAAVARAQIARLSRDLDQELSYWDYIRENPG